MDKLPVRPVLLAGSTASTDAMHVTNNPLNVKDSERESINDAVTMSESTTNGEGDRGAGPSTLSSSPVSNKVEETSDKLEVRLGCATDNSSS